MSDIDGGRSHFTYSHLGDGGQKRIRRRLRDALNFFSSHLTCLGINISPINVVVGMFVWLTWPVRVFLLNLVHR